ncbi:MAG: hypothetical protein ACK4EX_02345 [Thermaurantimonas sp.]|nr:hypothetical protein [Thermaurantimonas aggregans]
MPKRIKDPKLIEAKKRLRENIRKEFFELINDGRTIDYALSKLSDKYAYSKLTIYQMIKRFGIYKIDNYE